MTLDEAVKVAKVIGTADSACSTCVGNLIEKLADAFPEFEWTPGDEIVEHFHYDGSPASEDDEDFSRRRIIVDVHPRS